MMSCSPAKPWNSFNAVRAMRVALFSRGSSSLSTGDLQNVVVRGMLIDPTTTELLVGVT
jgi:hypothetical protein